MEALRVTIAGVQFSARRARLRPGGTAEGGCPHTSLLYESLARFLIQIGVPRKPKAARIWFSRKRW